MSWPFRDSGSLEQRTGVHLADLAEGSEEKRITFVQTQQAPVPVITSPEWSGSETGGRRYAPFTINVERLKPWHTLTGRMHFFLDHDWMRDLGEALPTYRPPLDMHRLFGEPTLGADGAKQVTVRYLTPHSSGRSTPSIKTTCSCCLSPAADRAIWLSPADAAAIGVADNDWMECVNANGVLVGRAIVSHRMPEGVVYRAPCSRADDRRAEVRGDRSPRWHPQLSDPAAGETHPSDRRIRPAVVRVQLPRSRPVISGTWSPPFERRSQEVQY